MAKGFGRRDFLKGVGAAALTAGLLGTSEARAFMDRDNDRGRPGLPDDLQPHPEIRANRGTERFWRKVRDTFVLPDNYFHMNTGTTGSQPLFSLINLGVYNLYKSKDPRDWQTNLNNDFPDLFPFVNNSALTARQTAIATQYNASPDEIVLDYNTTDACNLIFAGTPWNSGDRIICTHWEHAALAGPIAWARDYHGVDVTVLEFPSNFNMTADEVVNAFKAELLPYDPKRKQYIATCEVFYKNGVRFPVQQICQMAQDPKYKAFTIIDSAHGWGMLPVDCHGCGADFIAGAGHKWLCGGPGTGILYVRNSGTNLPPFAMGNFVSYGNLFTAPSANFGHRNYAPAGPVQSRGELNTPALYAMSDVAAYWNYLGVQDIYNRGVALGNYLKAKIAAQWGPNALWVQQNPDPSLATALTAFNPFYDKDNPGMFSTLNTAMNGVLTTLAGGDPKIYIRTVTWRDRKTDPADNRITFRVSTHGVYVDADQIDFMFDRLVAAVNATGLRQLG